jgi:hypothetical protein
LVEGGGGGVPGRQQDLDVGSILGGSWTALPLGQVLRNELERRLQVLRTAEQAPSGAIAATGQGGGGDDAEACAKATKMGVPVGVHLLFDFIYNEITLKKLLKNEQD